ncbi:MAG: polymer-forming cytoskeletal protein [Bacteroidota bacterium]
MFKSKDQKPVPTAAGMTHSHNSLVKGTTVEGKVKSKSDIRIDGSIKGSLDCQAKVVIGPTGYIEGEITCKNAVIMGQLEGNITVTESLKLENTAKVNGEITTTKFIVAPGAVFNGTCKMGKQERNGATGTIRKGTTKLNSGNANITPINKEAI